MNHIAWEKEEYKMKKKGLLALLLVGIMLFSTVGTVLAEGDANAEKLAWAATDFTYGEQSFELYPASEESEKIIINAWVITGLSEEGTEKLAQNTDMVIPATDPEGKQVQGIANSGLQKLGITSLELPKNVMATYDDTTWETTGKGLTERGNFFIGSSAFLGNSLTTLELPDGVIYVGGNAFKSNQLTKVTFPESIMWIGNAGFGQNAITTLRFPESTDFGLQLDNMAFAINQIKMVKLPSEVEKMHKWTFLQNAGMETIASGTTAEKKGGVVYLYQNAEEAGPYVDYKTKGTSVVQELFLGQFWTETDFTYDEAGTTVTGLSDMGKVKLTVEPNVVIPAVGPTDEPIIGIGAGTNMQGLFVVKDDAGTEEDATDDKYYTPESVVLPSTLKTIGNCAFALNPSLTYEAEMSEITLPEGLETIGQTAFQNSKLTSISIPDSVTTMGTGTFTGSANLTSVKLSANVVDIPQSAFNAGSATTMRIQSLVIPEGVQTIGRQAFTGAHIENLTLPSTLTEIGQSAFGNHQLTELTIPGSVEEIGKYAFRISQDGLEKGLTHLVLNEGLVTIGQYAFVGNMLTEVKLPSTVVLSTKDKVADCIFGTSTKAADPIVKLVVSDKTKVDEFNTEFANNYSHIVVFVGWESNEIGWWYQNADGSWPYSSWKFIDNEWYYFNGNGYMTTGWQNVNDTWYYLNVSGAMETGWICDAGTWYYLNASGAMETGWLYDAGTWYYLNENGAMATGWLLDGSTWYYLKANGAMATGWICDAGTWYYLNASGAMATGWVYDAGNWYYLNANGAMATGWIVDGGTKYFLNQSGAWMK